VIPYLVLTAVLSLAAGAVIGHRTARVRVIVIGATEQQDQAAVDAAQAAFIAHTRRRFDEMVAGLDLNTPDQEQQ
jgi:hypothetical protein